MRNLPKHSLLSRHLRGALSLFFLFLCIQNRAHAQERIIVSGAGPAGLVAAIQLQQQGHPVLLVEERAEDKWGTRSQVLGLSKESKNILTHLGITTEQFTKLQQYSFYRPNRRRVNPERKPNFSVPYTLPLVGLSWAVLRHNPDEMIVIGHLERQLLEIYKSLGGEILFDTRISSLKDGVADVENSTTHIIKETPYSLIINAEGANSNLNLMIGVIQKNSASWRTLYISGALQEQVTPEIRYLLKGPNDNEFLSTFFLTNGHYFSAGIDTLRSNIEDHDIDLHYQLAGIGVNANEVRNLRTQIITIQQGSLERFYFHKHKVAVIGDAAHAVNPLTAFGINLAIDEAAYLTKLLAQKEHLAPNDIKKLEARMHSNVRAANANHNRYSNQVPLITHGPQLLVDTGLSTVTKIAAACKKLLGK